MVKIIILLIVCTHGVFGAVTMQNCPTFGTSTMDTTPQWCKDDATVTYTLAKQNCEDLCSVLAVPTSDINAIAFHEMVNGVQRWVGIENDGTSWTGMGSYNKWPGGTEPASNGQCQAATFTFSTSTMAISYSAHSCGDTFPYQCQQPLNSACSASPSVAQTTKTYSQCSASCCFVGGTVNYTCSAGYQLSGFGGSIECTSSGYDVDASAGSCNAMPCSNYTLTNANHATANDTSGNYVYGTVVLFTCDNGYGLAGGVSTKLLTCDVSGSGVNWDSTVPNCQIIPCQAPPNITESTNDFSGDTSAGSTVNYTCNSGYSMADGNSTMGIECQVGGIWSATPVCTATPCNSPPTVANSNNDYAGNSSVDAIVTYTCTTGYEMADGNSSTSSTCMFGPYWSTPSSCQMIPCGAPTNEPNSTNDYTGNSSVGAIVTYTCDTGYILPDGNNSFSIECQFGSNWTEALTCQIVTCPGLNSSSITLGSYDSHSDTNFNTSVGLSCDSGYMYPTYRLQEEITCTENGTWDKNFTTCVVIQCPPVNLANTATFTLSNNYDVGSVLTITCSANHLIPGTSATSLTANCLNTAGWDQTVPNGCNFIQCPILSVTQATASATTRTYGASVTLTCDGGYQFSSFSSTTLTVTCQADSTWTPAVPASCDQFFCPPAQNVTYASYNTSSTAYDTVVGYTCDSGYMFPDGSVTKSTRCNELAAWTVTSIPACVAVTCPQLTPIDNGVINATNITYQSVATYVCDKGFMMPDGTKTGNQTCGVTATWTPSLNPSGCQVVNCTDPPPIGVFANYSEPLDDNQTSWMYNTKILYNCTEGYVFSTGDTQRFSKCTAEGDWLPREIICAGEPIKVEKRTKRYPPMEAPGAAVTGSFGLIFMITVIGCIVISDIGTLKNHLLMAKNNVLNRLSNPKPEESVPQDESDV